MFRVSGTSVCTRSSISSSSLYGSVTPTYSPRARTIFQSWRAIPGGGNTIADLRRTTRGARAGAVSGPSRGGSGQETNCGRPVGNSRARRERCCSPPPVSRRKAHTRHVRSYPKSAVMYASYHMIPGILYDVYDSVSLFALAIFPSAHLCPLPPGTSCIRTLCARERGICKVEISTCGSVPRVFCLLRRVLLSTCDTLYIDTRMTTTLQKRLIKIRRF